MHSKSTADYQQVTIPEAARALNVSVDTVRRRIRQGKLRGSIVNGRYLVELPVEPMQSGQDAYATRQDVYVEALLERIRSLELELEARRVEVQQLHSILYRPQLPGPSWWQRLFRRQS